MEEIGLVEACPSEESAAAGHGGADGACDECHCLAVGGRLALVWCGSVEAEQLVVFWVGRPGL